MIVKDRYPQMKTTYASILQQNIVQTKGSSLNKQPFYIQSSNSATGQTECQNLSTEEMHLEREDTILWRVGTVEKVL